jgi:hypothetical protein
MNENFADSVMLELMRRTVVMVDNMAEQVEDNVDDAMDRYYAAYKPKRYVRTHTMHNSVYMTNAAVVAPTTVEAGVGILMENRAYKQGYTLADAVEDADNYTHGGYNAKGAGVSVWHDPIEEVEKKQDKMWKKAARAAKIG